VLVAELVFLNAACVLLNWFAVRKIEGSKPTTHYCEGCAGSIEEWVEIGSESQTKNRDRTQVHGTNVSTRETAAVWEIRL
jgi:hypothetical protein